MPGWFVEFVLPPLMVAGGVVVLFWTGDRLVEHAAHLARSLRMPPTVVGAVVLGFGTSAPELVFSLIAAANGDEVLAIANVVGSNIANVGLILGIAAFLASVHVKRNLLRLDLPLGVLAVLVLIVGIGLSPESDGTVLLMAPMAVVLLSLFGLYLWLSIRHARSHRRETEAEPDVQPVVGRDLLWIFISLAGITLGAEMLRYGAERTALLLGVSEHVIGITMVALGTSLPELAATLAAVRKKQVDLAVGNLAGSNLFNLLFVLGVVTLTRPIPVPEMMRKVELPIAACFAILAFPLLRRERRIGRRQGALLLTLYFVFVLWVCLREA
ncbi:MAG: calcium/sodium antiporter [Planctomycetota bacterium]